VPVNPGEAQLVWGHVGVWVCEYVELLPNTSIKSRFSDAPQSLGDHLGSDIYIEWYSNKRISHAYY